MLSDTTRRKVEENSTDGGIIRSTPLVEKSLPVQKSKRKIGRVPHTCDLIVEDGGDLGSLWKGEKRAVGEREGSERGRILKQQHTLKVEM